jgi:hypothetical protein
VDREIRIVTIIVTTIVTIVAASLLSACALKAKCHPRATAAAQVDSWVEPERLRYDDPEALWVELQRLTYPEREAFMDRLGQDEASALVARVLTELAGPCSTVVFQECGIFYEEEGWRRDFPDSLTLGADGCLAAHFVVDYDSLLDANDRDVTDALFGLLNDDPGSYALLWDTVASVPVSAAPEAWVSLVLGGGYETDADGVVYERVWEHIASAPTEARLEACRYAAGQRYDADAAMRGAACLADLGDPSALPVRTKDLSVEEIAFALHMLAFDDSETAPARIATFAHPGGIRIVSEGDALPPDTESPWSETRTLAANAWTRGDLPFGSRHLPSHRVRGLLCDAGPPPTCRITRGRVSEDGTVTQGQFATIELTEHPDGGWAVIEARSFYAKPFCDEG